ncbi:MAG TPA: aegerolysin family protein [Arsenophonus nasoniae]|uniref:aegerolysin family protein n=1 Tax=Arsenophonus nasoniae TaxID=638 RepID=UPI003879005D
MNDNIRSYSQWAQIDISPIGFNSTIKDIELSWGKFHKKDDKDSEIPVSEIKGHTILDGKVYSIYTCGRSGVASGTTGKLTIFDNNSQIVKYEWDVPWGSNDNTSKLSEEDTSKYSFQFEKGNISSGALGKVTIKIIKLDDLCTSASIWDKGTRYPADKIVKWNNSIWRSKWESVGVKPGTPQVPGGDAYPWDKIKDCK